MENSNISPFRGRYHGQAKLALVGSLSSSVIAVLFLVFSFFSGPAPSVNGYRQTYALDIFAVIVTIGATGVLSLTLFRRLSAQIAIGGEDAETLDRIRLEVLGMAHAFSVALMFLAGMLMRR